MQPQSSPASSGVMLTRKGQKYADRHSRRPSQRTLRQLAKLREEAEAEIERLIGFLDKTEADPDLEPSLAGTYGNHAGDFGDDREADDADREPTFGWTEREARFGCQATPLQCDEAEDPHIDDEPSLGSIENHPSDTRRPNFYGELVGYFSGTTAAGSQLQWAAGNREDLEGDPREDEEEGGDTEPSLGSYNAIPGRSMVDGDAWSGQSQVVDSGMDQGDWSAGGTDDGEAAHDGREPSLGWSGNLNQDGGANWRGNAADREPDGDEQDENGDEQDRDGAFDDGGVAPSPHHRRRLHARRGQLPNLHAELPAACVITGPDGNRYRVTRQ